MSDPSQHNDLVSIVIPCFNQAKFIREAIQSVLSQTYRTFEIIVVDDGSEDELLEVLKDNSDIRIISQKNQGVSSARNAGLRESNGVYVLFLDADDRLKPEALEKGVRILHENKDLGFVSGHVELIAEDGAFQEIPANPCLDSDHYRTLLRYNYIWTPSAVMFRSGIVRSLSGFRHSLSGAADWDLYLRVAKQHPVLCHHEITAQYRRHGKSMNTDPGFMLMDCVRALRLHKPSMQANHQINEAYIEGIRGIQKYYGKPLVEEIRVAFRSHRIFRALRGIFILALYDPNSLKDLSSKSQVH